MTEAARHEITKKRIVYEVPGLDAVIVRRKMEYRKTDAGPLTLDIYYPPESTREERMPAVVFVIGFADPGAERMLGCKFNEMESFISWAESMAASGLVAITYTTGMEPDTDVHHLLTYVRQHGDAFGIDGNRIGLWACSGHAPNALSVLTQASGESLKCAALCYPYTLDLDGSTGVANASRTFRFVNPCAGRSVDDLPRQVPLFIARAGRDEMPYLNDALDRFVAAAVKRNLPVTLVNHPDAPHSFDLMDARDASREIIRLVLGFTRFHLCGSSELERA